VKQENSIQGNKDQLMARVSKRMRFIWLLLAAGALLYSQPSAAFEDDEACLICHKYPKMGRVTEDGTRRSYYIIPHIFGSTVHRNVPCTDCHTYIKQLPHRKVDVGVTCDTECHSIKNPATGKNFSHKAIFKKYLPSTHGRKKNATGLDADKPYCVTCHTNPVYNPNEPGPPPRIIARCIVCHEDSKFVENWYKHTSRRIKEVKRSSKEIVQLCASCHGDERLVERHIKAAKAEGRELGKKYRYAVESYMRSFHGKVTHYGFKKAPNCLDCHADSDNYYLSVHFIRPSRDPESPVSPQRKLETCKRCHIYANKNYAELDPHPTDDKKDNPFIYYAEIGYNWMAYIVIAGLLFMALMETIGRRRDGVVWRLRHGSSWWRRSKRDRDRVI